MLLEPLSQLLSRDVASSEIQHEALLLVDGRDNLETIQYQEGLHRRSGDVSREALVQIFVLGHDPARHFIELGVGRGQQVTERGASQFLWRKSETLGLGAQLVCLGGRELDGEPHDVEYCSVVDGGYTSYAWCAMTSPLKSMAKQRLGFFERESQWMLVLYLLLPVLAILLALVIPWVGRRWFS